jgi:hypothetical protein
MKPFRPSAAFQAYYDAVMAAANAPITPGLGPVVIPMPVLIDLRERAFATLKLAPIIPTINAYRASVPPLGGPPVFPLTPEQQAAQAAELQWQQASASAP